MIREIKQLRTEKCFFRTLFDSLLKAGKYTIIF